MFEEMDSQHKAQGTGTFMHTGIMFFSLILWLFVMCVCVRAMEFNISNYYTLQMHREMLFDLYCLCQYEN